MITSKRLARGSKTTVAYDVAGLPFFKKLWSGLKDKEQPNQAAITAAFERAQVIIKNKIPAFTQKNEPAEIQPFYVNLTLVVSATKEDQEEVADLLKVLEKMPLAEAEKLAAQLSKEAALRR